jgi:phosphoribosylamine--glycine ligase
MGAYCDGRILTEAQTGEILERIMLPALHAMNKDGNPFTGFLYAGLMMTADGPKLLEFNVRLGDPETQALMCSFRGDLAAFLEGDESAARWAEPSVCVVMAAEGYPDQPKIGDPIAGIGDAEATGAVVFQAGTMTSNGQIVTGGGRVLGVTAGAATLNEAIEGAYVGVKKIQFRGMQYRRDIGSKGLVRW